MVSLARFRKTEKERLPYLHRLGHYRLGPLVLIPPGTLEQSVQLFQVHASCLRNHQKGVDEGQETPTGKEEERSPVMGTGKKGRDSLVDAEKEQPVEGLGQGGAK